MRKVAVILVLAVFVPSLALAWLAIRSLRNQGFALERQRTLLYQGAAESTAKDVIVHIETRRREFKVLVDKLTGNQTAGEAAENFDARLRKAWPMAKVGFVVTLDGQVLAPSLFADAAARKFRLENDRFLTSLGGIEVYVDTPKGPMSLSKLDAKDSTKPSGQPILAQFKQVIGNGDEGTLARFLQDELNLLFWCRFEGDTNAVVGAQIDVHRLTDELRPLVRVEPGLTGDIVLALLDDQSRPVSTSRANFAGDWKRPFISRDIGDLLPHWKVGVYLANPNSLQTSASALRVVLGSVIGLLVVAIAIGGSLIVVDLKRQLMLARQKTDFVSNVSHELKTPLTSIRMFSELLAEGRVQEPDRQKQFLSIITAETARLTRLINNVLDFAKLERGEKKYQFEPVDVAALARETCETYRAHLEGSGFTFQCDLPNQVLPVQADRDALAQVLVNLLSNAEKYGGEKKQIELAAERNGSSVAVRVMDRGVGVPTGCEDKIFEQFFRAHDCLSSGIQGSGLGLTLARQIARAHGGDVTYSRREGGGSCFTLRLPTEAQT
jgi:signal transduction histidine kinase